jgi:hypothetical protein
MDLWNVNIVSDPVGRPGALGATGHRPRPLVAARRGAAAEFLGGCGELGSSRRRRASRFRFAQPLVSRRAAIGPLIAARRSMVPKHADASRGSAMRHNFALRPALGSG